MICTGTEKAKVWNLQCGKAKATEDRTPGLQLLTFLKLLVSVQGVFVEWRKWQARASHRENWREKVKEKVGEQGAL